MAIVTVGEHENPETAFKRFKRARDKAGIPSAVKKKEFYQKPCEYKKQKHAQAIKRLQKKELKERSIRQQRLSKLRAIKDRAVSIKALMGVQDTVLTEVGHS